MNDGEMDRFKHGLASFLMRRPDLRPYLCKADRMHDMFVCYSQALQQRDRLRQRTFASLDSIVESEEFCRGLEDEIACLLPHYSGPRMIH